MNPRNVLVQTNVLLLSITTLASNVALAQTSGEDATAVANSAPSGAESTANVPPQPTQEPVGSANVTPSGNTSAQGAAEVPSSAPIAASQPAPAQPVQLPIEPEPASPPPVLKGRRTLGIGIQAAPFPLFGPSIIYSPIEHIGIELLGEAFIDLDWIGARALLRPFPKPGHRFYFSGFVGHFVDHKFSENVFSPDRTETALGYGAGLGFAFFFKRQSPFEVNLELDYVHIDFAPSWKYDFGAVNLIMAGFGIHYYVL